MNPKRIFVVMMVLVAATLIMSLAPAFAQVDTAWVRSYGGSASAVAVDIFGNVSVTGTNGTIKYDANGTQLWVGPWGGVDIAVDSSGNVYVIGDKVEEFYVIKYYSNGDTAWVRTYTGPYDFGVGVAIAVDASGYVYGTGYSYTYWYDDYVTIKYDPNGNELWVEKYDGLLSWYDEANDIVVDASDNVYVTGKSWGWSSPNYATIKYMPSGDTAWVRIYDGPTNGDDAAYAITVDVAGNVYVTGGSDSSGTRLDYATIKYHPNGETAWVRRYNGPGNDNDVAYAIAVDGSGNVCVTGKSVGSGTSDDYATMKYDPNGNTAWVRRYNGPGDSTDCANAIAVDDFGNVYVTGESYGSGTSYDYATIEYHPNGDTAWVRRYNGPANSTDKANAIAVDWCRNVYVTGKSHTIKYEWLCPGPYRIEYPSHWFDPPLKVTPNGSRTLIMKVFNCGCANLSYGVTSDNPCIQVSASGTLPAHDSVTVTAIVSGSGACNNKFICGNVILTTNEGGGKVDSFPVQAVAANDYFECPYDPLTVDTLTNGVLGLYTNANCEEWIHDIATFSPDTHEVFKEGGTIVATTRSGDTLVGRYMGQNDQHGLAAKRLYLDDYSCFGTRDFWVLYTWDIKIHDLNPPMDPKWWWWEMDKEIVFFKPNASDALKHTIIKFIRVKWHRPPVWWPEQPAFGSYNDVYGGIAMDIDCPWDTLGSENGRNKAGYDATKNIAYQQGWDYTGAHPQYNNYYAGIALANGGTSGESEVPYGAYNVKNHKHLYPQAPWGWLDGDLYQLAATPGSTIEDPDSIVDRTQVLTARKLNAGTDTTKQFTFTIIEAMTGNGLAQLQADVDAGRAWVQANPLIVCGDLNSDCVVDVGDVVFLLAYLYKGGAAPVPLERANVNPDGVVNVGDVIYLLNYLFKGGAKPHCYGIIR